MPRGRERHPGCGEVRRVLQAFLDGEVTGDRARQVAAHLERCPRCGCEAWELRTVIAQIRSLRSDLDPAAYTRLVRAVDRLTTVGDLRSRSEDR